MITNFIDPLDFETEEFMVEQPNLYTTVITNKTDRVIGFKFSYMDPGARYPRVLVQIADQPVEGNMGLVVKPHQSEEFYFDLDLEYDIPGYAECKKKWLAEERKKQEAKKEACNADSDVSNDISPDDLPF